MEHNKGTAKRFLKIIAATRADGVECAFAVGMLDDKHVAIASRKAASATRSALLTMDPGDLFKEKEAAEAKKQAAEEKKREIAWNKEVAEAKKKGKTPPKKPNEMAPRKAKVEKPKILSWGIAKLDGTTLTLRCKKPSKAATLARAFRSYFKGEFDLVPLWSKVVHTKLTEADLGAYIALEDDRELDLLSDDDLQDEMASRLQDGIEEDEGVDDWAPTDTEITKEESDIDTDPHTDPDADDTEASDGASVALPQPPLSPEVQRLEQSARQALEPIVKTLLTVAASTGVAIRTNQDDLVAKLTDWLIRILQATPQPADLDALMANWLCRLQLAMSSVEHMRSVQHTKKAIPGTKPAADATQADGKILDGRIDLADVTTENVGPEAVVDMLFAEALFIADRRALPYDLTRASDAKIDKIVRGSWPKEAGQAQVQAIERLKTALRSAFSDDGRLANYLGLTDAKLEPSAALIENVIRPAIQRWTAAHASAKAQIDAVKASAEAALQEADRSFSVANLGGSWSAVDGILVQLDTIEIPNGLQAFANATDPEARLRAFSEAKNTLQTYKAYLANNSMVTMLDSAPFGVQSTIKDTLEDGLDFVDMALQSGFMSAAMPK